MCAESQCSKLISYPLHASNSATAAPQNQLQLAECSCRKSCMVGCEVPTGLATKSLLNVRLRCKASHASNSASAAPQNQLHLPKNLHGGLRCATRGWRLKSVC